MGIGRDIKKLKGDWRLETEKLIEKIKAMDRFASLTGIEIQEAGEGTAKVCMKVAEKHLNSVDITHGGAIFTLADMAFALASNSGDKTALALNMSINFLKATRAGDILTAYASQDKVTNRTGAYRIVIEDQAGELVAVAQGLAYRLGENLIK